MEPGVELYNGTFTPINAIELSFDDKQIGDEFGIDQEKKYITTRVSGNFNLEAEFKLPKKSNYILQLKIINEDSIKTLKINDKELIGRKSEKFENNMFIART